MVCYKCFELHTHTVASDGKFMLEQLCESAAQYQYDGIALTDHNTMSGLQDMTAELAVRVPVIPGIEWTTFFGHMVVIGAEEYVDWRFARPDDIDVYIEKIKRVGGVVGIAHPFNEGSPLCTGCYWSFNIQNWQNVDYIEVWSEPSPHERSKNVRAFLWWTELLNNGHHIAATSGRDWHGPEKTAAPTPATYLGLADGVITTQTVKDALRAGRTFVTCGPVLRVSLFSGVDKTFGIGDTISAGQHRLSLAVDERDRRAIWERFGICTKTLSVIHNGAVIAEVRGDGSFDAALDISLGSGWLRIEGYGDYYGQKDKLLFFSSPIYISECL